jgi:DNA-directed RNA polymerase alpha subunit
MTVVPSTIYLPADLRHAVQALASSQGDTNTVILRALEEYISASSKRRGRRRPGKYQKLVKALSTPVADLHLSARLASALRTLNIKYVYDLVQTSPVDLFGLPNFGEKSLREVTANLAHLGLTLDMPLEEDAYRAAVVATVAASIETTRG